PPAWKPTRRLGLSTEHRYRQSCRVGGTAPGGRTALPRWRGAAATLLGRIPGRAGLDRVLAEPAETPARSPALQSSARRHLAPRAPLPIGAGRSTPASHSITAAVPGAPQRLGGRRPLDCARDGTKTRAQW